MMTPSLFLRRALAADAIFSGAGAVIFTLGAGELAPLFELPEALLRETGLFLIVYAAWTLASIALLFSGAVTPNLLGEAAVVAQAIATGILAELQFIGLRRSG